nr:NS2 accessory protein [Equine coronavirus]
MSVAYADRPTHFINFPLISFEGFMLNFKDLQFRLLEEGVDCKLQMVPHVSLAMLDIVQDQIKCVDTSLQQVIDCICWDDGFHINFGNPKILGRCVVLEVKGLEELHGEIERSISEKGCVVGQSRPWIAHCTIAQLTDAALVINENLDFINSLQFNYTITINPASPSRLELVKIGAEKKDGFYKSVVSHWMGIRFYYKPPTDKLAMIMGYCCLEKIREELDGEDFPQHDDDAWSKLSYHYENNLWFYRHVYRNSSYFRLVCKLKDCICMGYDSSEVEEI